MAGKNKVKKMADLQQATVKLVLDALHSTNLTIESFIMIMMAICGEPSLKVLLEWRYRDSLCQNVLISVTVSNWVTWQAMKIYKEVEPYFQ